MTDERRQTVREVRVAAADHAAARFHPHHLANGDEQRYADARYAMSFTKGLEHDATTGLLKNADHFEAFRNAIDTGFIDAFTASVPVPMPKQGERRQWEAPTAGLVYDLEGPDAQAVTMDPAPALGSSELAYEMAEVYELALLRDEPLSAFIDGGGSSKLKESLKRLNKLPYTQQGFPGRPRLHGKNAEIEEQQAFRGSSPGVTEGPYLSQFMLIGSPEVLDPAGVSGVTKGRIQYGSISIDQKVAEATEGRDYMQNKDDWLEVQNGFMPTPDQEYTGNTRFMSTPRDLATYVHYDALYEAYLNACIILLDMGTPFDPGFDALSGMRDFVAVGNSRHRRNAGGFALYGGPHILTLVTEVATRALKAVRYQKFNVHIRLRPEALAGRLACRSQFGDFPRFSHALNALADEIEHTIKEVENFNKKTCKASEAFLPMAFNEGSPMHPAYGAGHATVAGACVTILKAYFDTSTVLVKPGGKDEARFKHFEPDCGDTSVAYVSDYQAGNQDSGQKLKEAPVDKPLTLEGELNKLAANISIGRNMAGVHYFTDYYDSLRMGEAIAIGMLEEQALCYRTDPFVMSLATFDGDVVRVGAR